MQASHCLVALTTFALLGSAMPVFGAVVSARQNCGNQSVMSDDSGLFSAAASAAAANAPAGNLGSSASASAGSLYLTAYAEGVSTYPEPGGVLCSSFASGQTFENVFIDTPFTGTGTATVHAHASGVVGAESSSTSSVYASSVASWSISFGGVTRGGTIAERSRFGQVTRSEAGDPLDDYVFTVTVRFDSWIPMAITGAVTAQTFDYGALSGFFLPGQADAAAVFGESFHFLGISEIVDENGNLVPFTAIGESGRNYRFVDEPRAVSEPGALMLLLLALASLTVVLRSPARTSPFRRRG